MSVTELGYKMSISELVDNKFWDNSNPKGPSEKIIYDTNKRHEFLIAFGKWAEPYCTKNTKWIGIGLGLFGTSSGLEIKIHTGNIKKSVDMDIEDLIIKFGEENNIPVYTIGGKSSCKVFSNKYSLISHEEFYSSYYDKYSTRCIDAYKEVYGKPLYKKTKKILGNLFEILNEFDDEDYIKITNYNHVGSIIDNAGLIKQALKETGIDFDVIEIKNTDIRIQEDDYDLIKKIEYTIKQIRRN